MYAKNIFWRKKAQGTVYTIQYLGNAIYYYAEKILLRRKIPRNTTQTFKIVSRKFLTASILYFYAIDGVKKIVQWLWSINLT